MLEAFMKFLGRAVYVAGPKFLRKAQKKAAKSGLYGGDRYDFLGALPHLAKNPITGAAVALMIETGREILKRPGFQATFDATKMKWLTGEAEKIQSIAAVKRAVDRIAKILEKRGVAPRRLAVDGVPGSGKSTLARAIAERFDMEWRSLDHEDMQTARDFQQEGAVYEHHRLFRTQDVDIFDALIYINEPVEISITKVLMRKRGGYLIDLVDFERLKRIGEMAFDACDGKAIKIPHSGLLMKIRPREGFRADENIDKKLQNNGGSRPDLGKEAKLFLLAYGKPQTGFKAYIRLGKFNQEILRGLSAGIRRYLDE